jgi:hypothetical protein
MQKEGYTERRLHRKKAMQKRGYVHMYGEKKAVQLRGFTRLKAPLSDQDTRKTPSCTGNSFTGLHNPTYLRKTREALLHKNSTQPGGGT